MPLLHGFGLFSGATVAGLAGAAYFGGGPGATTTVDKFLFSDESSAALATGLSVGRTMLNSGFASSTAGYAAGGVDAPVYYTTVDKFLFSDDSRSTLGTGLSSARYGLGGFDSSTAGYAAGGYASSVSNSVTTVDKFLFSDDSRSTLGTGLSVKRHILAGFSSDTAGYAVAGANHLVAVLSTVDKFSFADDSRSTLATGTSSVSRAGTGFMSATAGYFTGGDNGPPTFTVLSNVDKFSFADDSRTTLASGLTTISGRGLQGNSAPLAGYTARFGALNKTTFSDDSQSTLATTLSFSKSYMFGFSNRRAL